MEVSIDSIVQSLSQTKWRTARSLTPEARSFAMAFLEKIRPVLQHIMARKELHLSDAFIEAYTAGPQTPQHEELLCRLHKEVAFRSAGVRETIIHPVISNYLWAEDERFAGFDNPWKPLMSLYSLGYTTDFQMDPGSDAAELVVGFRNGEERFPIT